MTNATHTPGAWRITDDFIGVHDQQGRCIADMDSEGAPDIGYDESLANARLIAAAPDMLWTLEQVDTYLSPMDDEEDVYAEIRGVIQAAIAKAKGA